MKHLVIDYSNEKFMVLHLKMSDNSFYCGCTTDLENRINEHKFGIFKGYTSARLPIDLVYFQEFSNINDAINAERQIKKWSRKKKEALVNGNFNLLHELAKCKNESSSYNKKLIQ